MKALPPINVAEQCPETFGQALRSIRSTKTKNGRKLTQGQAGKYAIVSKTRIYDWETGKALPDNVDIIEDLARKMHCSEEETARLLNAFLCDNLIRLGVKRYLK